MAHVIMENTTQQPYTANASTTTTTRHTSSPSSSTSSTSTIKPLPALPLDAHPTAEEPYRDDPATPVLPSLSTHHYRPYTDLPSPSEPPSPTNDDDVPLAQLLLSPQYQRAPPYQQHQQQYQPNHHSQSTYPLDAPPSYSVAIRQSYSSTLIQWIPSRPSDPLLIDVEADGEDGERPDEVRHAVEKVVAMFVVATLLLVIAGVLGWLALGSGLWD